MLDSNGTVLYFVNWSIWFTIVRSKEIRDYCAISWMYTYLVHQPINFSGLTFRNYIIGIEIDLREDCAQNESPTVQNRALVSESCLLIKIGSKLCLLVNW